MDKWLQGIAEMLGLGHRGGQNGHADRDEIERRQREEARRRLHALDIRVEMLTRREKERRSEERR